MERDTREIVEEEKEGGVVWRAGEIRALLLDNPERVVVVDESFIRFAPEAESAIPLLGECGNLLVVCSMTKCYAIPGLRLGYVLGNEGLIKRLGRFSLPWSVNALAIEVGKYILQHPEQFVLPLEQWLNETHRLQEQIRSLGIESYPSAVTFFLNRLPEGRKASQLKDYLLKEKQILIRDASNFRTLDERCFRLSTQRPEENEVLLDAIRDWIK